MLGLQGRGSYGPKEIRSKEPIRKEPKISLEDAMDESTDRVQLVEDQ